MKRGCLAVLDSDEKYLDRLGEYLNGKEFVTLSVCVFLNQEKFDKFIEEEDVDLILVSQKLWKEEYGERASVVLYENPMEIPRMQEAVYKYQSARLIGLEIMEIYAKTVKDDIFIPNKKESRLYGVFPVEDGSSATLLAWEMAKYLSAGEKVLYISIKAFSGMMTKLDGNQGSNLADCIFFMRRKEGNILLKIQSAICRGDSFDYLPSMESEDDIRDVSEDEWECFLMEITKKLDYEYVILDLSEAAGSLLFWIKLCDFVFSPVSGELANISVAERKKWFESRNQMEIMKKWIFFPGERIRMAEPYSFRRNNDIFQQIEQIFHEKEVLNGKV